MAAGLGLLRLEPRAFWSMTLKELQAALVAITGPEATCAPPTRRDMTGLMQRFPDRRVRDER